MDIVSLALGKDRLRASPHVRCVPTAYLDDLQLGPCQSAAVSPLHARREGFLYGPYERRSSSLFTRRFRGRDLRVRLVGTVFPWERDLALFL